MVPCFGLLQVAQAYGELGGYVNVLSFALSCQPLETVQLVKQEPSTPLLQVYW